MSSRGRYIVGALIGDGQYGSVYECVGPFDQEYALKMLRPANKPYQAVKEEWSREMMRLETVRHPHVVYIHDAFEDNYLFYFALEKCDTSLKALIGRPMQDGFIVEVARQLLLTLQYLHDTGVVHSDLHPGNVLLSQLDRTPIVKLTDFGVAHQLDPSQRWFRPQVANPKILTPELVTQGYTTTQSDLYQLGLLMFQMLTGQSAIDQNVAYQDVARQIAEGTARQRAEALGTPLGTVTAKLLRRREGYRYQSAREVWEDLRPLWWGRHVTPFPNPSHPGATPALLQAQKAVQVPLMMQPSASVHPLSQSQVHGISPLAQSQVHAVSPLAQSQVHAVSPLAQSQVHAVSPAAHLPPTLVSPPPARLAPVPPQPAPDQDAWSGDTSDHVPTPMIPPPGPKGSQ